MLRVSLLSFVLLLNIEARENPFLPSQGEIDLSYTSNQITTLKRLKMATLSVPDTARVIKKVTIEYENLDASTETKSIELNNLIDWHLPLLISQNYNLQEEVKNRPIVENKKSMNFQAIAKIKYSEFLIYKNLLKIRTKDKIIRNFLLAKPHRIVLDFKRDSSMKSYFKTIKQSSYAKIRIGNHKGYYRVVIELDGMYKYRLDKEDKGYLISLH